MSRLKFTPNEAAVLSGMPLRQVNRAIDKRTIPVELSNAHGEPQRHLPLSSVICLAVEMNGAKNFPPKKRREIYTAITSDARSSEVRAGNLIVIDIAGARREVASRLRSLRKVERMVVRNPEILGGTPVFRGTRVPVHGIARMLQMGASAEEILEGYPSINAEQLRLAVLYSAASPRRGRPPARPWKTQVQSRKAS